MSRRASLMPAGETRRLLHLAWPVMLTSLNWTILHVTDVIVVGLAGSHEVAALSASRSLTYVAIVTGLAWLSGVLVRASRADGAGDLAATGQVFRDGVVMGALLGLAAAAILLVGADALLAGIGVAPAMVAPGAAVVRVMAWGYPLQLVMIAASFVLEGISRPGRVAVVNLATLPINGVLAWILATGQFGAPALGAVGAGIATVTASAIGAVGMVASVLLLPRAAERGVRRIDPAAWTAVPRGMASLLTFGAVPAVASGLELAGFSILIALSTRLGEPVAHAFQITFSVHNLTFAIALGLASAAGVRAGNAVGEGAPGAAIGRTLIALALTAATLALITVALFLGAPAIVAAFPAGAEAHRIGRAMLVHWAPFIVFDGIQLVLVYALRSLGDQVAAGVNSILAYFVVTGGLGWWLVTGGAGPMGLVWASGAGMVAAAVLHGARFAIVSRRFRQQS